MQRNDRSYKDLKQKQKSAIADYLSCGFYFQMERWIDMPRMSKKRKQEWALFLNDRNRITYNELCRKCRNDCKQSFRCIVVLCPKYLSKRRTKKND